MIAKSLLTTIVVLDSVSTFIINMKEFLTLFS